MHWAVIWGTTCFFINPTAINTLSTLLSNWSFEVVCCNLNTNKMSHDRVIVACRMLQEMSCRTAPSVDRLVQIQSCCHFTGNFGTRPVCQLPGYFSGAQNIPATRLSMVVTSQPGRLWEGEGGGVWINLNMVFEGAFTSLTLSYS